MAKYSLEEVMSEGGKKTYTLSDVSESEPVGKAMNREIGSIPRQLGLTARYGLEGLATIPELLGNAMEGVGIKGAGGNIGKTVSDWIGLPKPEGVTENTVAEATKLMAGTGGIVKGANALANVAGQTARPVLQQMAANSGLQTASAAGAGGAGEYVKQTGGDPTSQLVAAVAGGLSAPAAVSALRNAPRAIGNAARSTVEYVAPGVTRPNVTNVDVIIQNALQPSGVTLSDIPANVLTQLRQDVSRASQMGNLSQDAIRRLADYRLVGATPLRGNLTLNPVEITREKNLAKLGANTEDATLSGLAMRENQNNSALIEGLNSLAPRPRDSYAAGETVIDALQRNDNYSRWVIDNLYGAARNSQGRSAMLEPSVFTNSANDALDQALLGGKLPADVRNLLNRVANGEMPLTVDVAEQFKTRIGALQRASNDPAERLALGHVRNALDNTPLAGSQGQEAIDAFNAARRANAGWMNVVENTPALQAVRDGVEPDKFVNQFIIGNGNNASVMSVAQLRNQIGNQPEAMNAVRGQIVSFLKEKALSGASDEVGKVSQSNLNKAIESIGERKLRLFFNQQEINQLRALGRVASYEQVQPTGSAVNNSNTAAMGLGVTLDKLSRMPILNRIPLGQQVVAQPMMNIAGGLNAARATNVPASLVLPMNRRPSILPSAVMPGLLATQE